MKLSVFALSLLVMGTTAPIGICHAQPQEHLDFSEAHKIVVQAGGRKKPFQTFAIETLRTLTGRAQFRDPDTRHPMDPVDTLLAIWFAPEQWHTKPVILVSSARLRDVLGLNTSERLVSFAALMSNARLRELHSAIAAKRASDSDLSPLEQEAETVIGRMELLNQLMHGDAIRIVPDPANASGPWRSPTDESASQSHPDLAGTFAAFRSSYLANHRADFTENSIRLRQQLHGSAPTHFPAAAAITREIHYNTLHPFRWAWVLYLFSSLLLLIPKARRFGLVLFGAGVLVHSYGFVLRTWISGNAPVTNMYESVVWVSWGTAALAWWLDWRQRSRLYMLTAAPIAIAGLIIADMLPTVLNPKIGPLPPVLRDNFWLVTHVLTITLGYAAFALAMGLGHVLMIRSLFKSQRQHEPSPSHHFLHRVLQIGVLLLAAGTILGGVWANYSWGRFWGWDPKETWALIALLLYIFALHGRVAGWWGDFGLCVAAAVCFNGVLMAWYGVNFVLGKGLHSYGFGGGGLFWIGLLVGIDLLFVLACAGIRIYRSVVNGTDRAGQGTHTSLNVTTNLS